MSSKVCILKPFNIEEKEDGAGVVCETSSLVDLMSSLPEDVLLHLATFLCGRDTRALGLTNTHLHSMLGQGEVWRRVLAREGRWPVTLQVQPLYTCTTTYKPTNRTSEVFNISSNINFSVIPVIKGIIY